MEKGNRLYRFYFISLMGDAKLLQNAKCTIGQTKQKYKEYF